MLRHFMSMLVDEHTVMLDPTCGLGSALRAAESLGASYVLGMDTDEQVVGQARMLLRQSRSMRLASKHSTKGGQG
jgi:tRNA G10  N-methylase Trm11